MTLSPTSAPRVLVTGATGYIGGRLVPWLLRAGYQVHCLARNPRKLADRPWAVDSRVTLFEGDVGDDASLDQALEGCSAAFYLVHSMMARGASYRAEDRRLARRFAAAAERAALQQIIYLGGLGETGAGLSEHLSSRREVELELASGAVPVTTLRAAMIIGSGSASFEILRYLVERLPVLVTPRWVRTECQPIAVRNVLQYLVDCLRVPEVRGQTLEIGGPDVLNYEELMHTMAELRGLPRRLIVPVPVLTPRLSSLWIHLVTPLSRHIARPLAEGLRNRVVLRDDRAARLMPQRLLSVREAIDAALGRVRSNEVDTAWSDAGPIPGDPDWSGGTVFEDPYEIEVAASPERTFAAACRIGGRRGYYRGTWLWKLRGYLDRLVGGPGLRRGRKHPDELSYGCALDFWRVTGLEEGRRVELRAEMKLPGDAMLEMAAEPVGAPDRSRLRLVARFKPTGLFGLLYWFAVLPLHGLVFRGMLEGIRRDAESRRSVRSGAPATSAGSREDPVLEAPSPR